MVYCQQCGAENAGEARFCNQCGAKIAGAGEPGGPLATIADAPLGDATRPDGHGERERSSFPGGPPPSPSIDISTVSLSAIGMRSRVKAWGVILGAVAVLVGLGAGGTWLAMRGTESEPAASEGTDPAAPEQVVIGDLLPEGQDAPDVLTGAPEPTGRTTGGTKASGGAAASKSGGSGGSGGSASAGSGGSGSAGSGSGGSGSAGSGSGGSGSAGSGSGGSGSAGSGSGGSGSAGSGSGGSGSGGSGSAGSGSGGSGSAGSGSGGSGSGGSGSGSGGSGSGGTGGSGSGGSGSAGSGSGGSGSGGSGGTRPEPDWEAMEEQELAERDFEMEAYASRVRSVVRDYYARRAQTCFDTATRNNESVRGTIMIGFTIQASGEIVNSNVVRNTTGIDTIGACLARQVDTWRLPPPPQGNAPLAMQMPFSR